MQSVHLSFAPLAINLSSTLKVSPQRCRICLHSHLACEESPSVFKCLRSTTNYTLLKFMLVFVCCHCAILENPLPQAWDLIPGYSCVICIHCTSAQEDLVSFLYSQTLPYDLVRAHLLSLLRSCLVISLLLSSC